MSAASPRKQKLLQLRGLPSDRARVASLPPPLDSGKLFENYLGFPAGLTGQELADRAIAQAEKFRIFADQGPKIQFGARIMVARTVQRLNCESRPYSVTLDDGHEIPTRTIVLATGAQYNKPPLRNLEAFSFGGSLTPAIFGFGRIECQAFLSVRRT